MNSGSREITLLGQNVNAYRSGEKKLSDLIIELEKIDRLKRIRYTTSHPNDMTYDLIEVHKTSKKLMPLLHLPVQSGSNKILKSMNRKHKIEDYLDLVKKKEIISKFLENFNNIKDLVEYFDQFEENLSKKTLNSYLKSVINP